MGGWRARIGTGGLSLILAASLTLQAGMARAETVTKPVLPGELGPANPLATRPPEIPAEPPRDGVIKPPGDISRMPVIKPQVPSRMPVLPPASEVPPPGTTKVVPK